MSDLVNFPAAATNLPGVAPDFSKEDYALLGVTLAETEEHLLLEVPFVAQKAIVELGKRQGFGAARFVNDVQHDMLIKFGFHKVTKINLEVNPETYAWVAIQEKNPKAEAAAEIESAAPATTVTTSSAVVAPNEEGNVAHKSGATSSHFSPFSFYNRFEGVKLTCLRFLAGNRKHEKGTTVYAEMNWLKALAARDVAFFRDRAGHAVEHLLAEMHGNDDDDPGGNLGAVGWWVEVFAYVKKNDPFFYACIQGKCHIDNAEAEETYALDKLLGEPLAQ